MNSITFNHIKNVDDIVTMRAKVLLFAAFSMALWQFGWIAKDMLKEYSTLNHQIAGWVSVLGCLFILVATFLIFKLNKKIKQTKTWSVLHDELVIKNRNSSFFYSYFVLFGMIWLLIPILDAIRIDAKYAIRIIATLGILLPMVIFSISELRNDLEAE